MPNIIRDLEDTKKIQSHVPYKLMIDWWNENNPGLKEQTAEDFVMEFYYNNVPSAEWQRDWFAKNIKVSTGCRVMAKEKDSCMGDNIGNLKSKASMFDWLCSHFVKCYIQNGKYALQYTMDDFENIELVYGDTFEDAVTNAILKEGEKIDKPTGRGNCPDCDWFGVPFGCNTERDSEGCNRNRKPRSTDGKE